MQLRFIEGNHSTGLVEFAALAQLRTELGAEDFAAIVTTLEVEATLQLDRLAERSAVGDIDGVCRIAHNLAGLFAQFGATEAARLAQIASTPTLPALHQALYQSLHLNSRQAIDAICGFVPVNTTTVPDPL